MRVFKIKRKWNYYEMELATEDDDYVGKLTINNSEMLDRVDNLEKEEINLLFFTGGGEKWQELRKKALELQYE